MDRYFQRSFDYVVDYLRQGHDSRPARLDPVGEMNLRLAKKIRHRALAEGGVEDPAVVEERADDFFPFPDDPLLYWPRLEPTEIRGILAPGGEAKDGEAGNDEPVPDEGGEPGDTGSLSGQLLP